MTGRGDALQLLAVPVQRARMRTLRAGDEELGRLALPGRTVDHRLSIWSKPRGSGWYLGGRSVDLVEPAEWCGSARHERTSRSPRSATRAAAIAGRTKRPDRAVGVMTGATRDGSSAGGAAAIPVPDDLLEAECAATERCESRVRLRISPPLRASRLQTDSASLGPFRARGRESAPTAAADPDSTATTVPATDSGCFQTRPPRCSRRTPACR